jgi:hypothetical protein
MATLEGPALCRPVAHLKSLRLPTATVFAGNHFSKRGSNFWGFTCNYRSIDSVSFGKSIRNSKGLSICYSFSSSSDDNGSMAGNFSERDGDYVDSSVMEAGNFCFPYCFILFESNPDMALELFVVSPLLNIWITS